jgi:hypothetical protein
MKSPDVVAVLVTLNPYPTTVASPDFPEDRAETVRLMAEAVAAKVGPVREHVKRPVVTSRRVIGRSLVAAAVVLLIVAAFVGSPLRGRTVSASATPPLLQFSGTSQSAAKVLHDAAVNASRQPDPSDGRYIYTEAEGWGLLTSQREGGDSSSGFVPTVDETWWAADGSGRVVTYTGEPSPAGTVPPEVDTSGAGDVQDFGAGQLPDRFDFTQLSAAPDTLRQQLLASRPTDDVDGIPANAYVWSQATQALEQDPPPAIRAALLEVLAAIPEAQALGTATAYDQQSGVGVALESDWSGLPTRYELLLDPDAGSLLATDQVLTQTAGHLNVAVPSVIAYDEILKAGHTSSLDSRP